MGGRLSGLDDESPSPATKLLEKDVGRAENGEKKVKYPKSVFFIMGNEFCERFSYYGMRTVLTLYLTNILLFSENNATITYHSFTMLCYFTPVFGAILSDSLLGKFKTIFYISIVYAIGNVVLSLASIPDFPLMPLSILGLLLIGVGTGGIKPCVAAFGGDQFEANQEKERQRFFSIFYFCINAGSLLSTFFTPMLRSGVTCFGEDTCYPLAFGVPAILMVISLVLFLAGRPLYKIYPPQGTVLIDLAKCVFHAIVNFFSSSSPRREHWLDHASDKFDGEFIEDVKSVLRVLFLYLPLPFFWALFDQMGSRWTLQATRMDGTVPYVNVVIQPDQIQVINPLLIIVMIPVFELVIYPLLTKCNILTKPLQRISVGGLLAALSFVIAGFLQIALEKTLPVHVSPGLTDIMVVNSLPCGLSVDLAGSNFDVSPLSNYSLVNVNATFDHFGSVVFSPNGHLDCPLGHNVSGGIRFLSKSEEAFTLAVGVVNDKVVFRQGEELRRKADQGKSEVNFQFRLSNGLNGTIMLKSTKKDGEHYNIPLSDDGSGFGLTNYTVIEPDTYEVYVPLPSNFSDHRTEPSGVFRTKQGAVYTVVVYHPAESNGTLNVVETVSANTVLMLLQLPQYLIITFGEIMFSITGLEFSYSQAPASMKAVLQAAWLLTVAFGNLIVVIIAEAQIFETQSYEFFLFAGLMGLDMIIFIVMAYFYKYVKSDNDRQSPKEKESEGVANPAYEDDTKM